MKLSDYHAKYYAYELTKRSPSDSIDKLAASLFDAQVDLNPHQVEAALFAFKSPLSKGAILADEVGLGKTIEAGLVIAQKWAERKRKILIIVPANLRKQWSQELQDKFFLSSTIMETASFNDEIKKGNLNPLENEKIIICSYNFARAKDVYISKVQWDLVVIDEAHRLRNVYKTSSKIANAIKNAVSHAPKILLTATPLQNTLNELYGLVSIIDEYTFGDLKSFKSQFTRLEEQHQFDDLKSRLAPVCKRTLRRQVLEYVPYTNRLPILEEYTPYPDEEKLYEFVSSYLQRDKLYALPASQRHLMTLILRRLLASSSFAIADTLGGLIERLNGIIDNIPVEHPELPFLNDFDSLTNLKEEWNATDNKLENKIDDTEEDGEDESTPKNNNFTVADIEKIKEEIKHLEDYEQIAKEIVRNAKGEHLIIALRKGLTEIDRLGGKRKAIIFTESKRTQEYIDQLLQETEFKGQTVFFNGTNSDKRSKEIYSAWFAKHKGTDRVTGSPTADKRAAIVDHFRDNASIMIATEAAAEGINLQFCSLVINYDLPWNPQRIEQRIGRCHRYGQQCDVVVVNFLNKKNDADQRVYRLLEEKFSLFSGVFGASDEVLGSIESGVEFEKRIASIYQRCRTPEEIQSAFDDLQKDLEGQIDSTLQSTRKQLLENFDEEVHEKLRLNLKNSRECLSKYEEWLWKITRHSIADFASFEDETASFTLHENPFPECNIPTGRYKFKGDGEDSHIFRIGHPLAQGIFKSLKKSQLDAKKLIFKYSNHNSKISILSPLKGKTGYLTASFMTVSALEDEDYILLSGVTEDGTVLDSEQCQRLFSIPAEEISGTIQFPDDINKKLDENLNAHESSIIDSIGMRNSDFFDEEMTKLDKWADDKKNSMELELKQLEVEIKTRKTESRKIRILADKLKVREKIQEFERKRNKMRMDIYAMQDEVDKNKEDLINQTKKRLNQKVIRSEIFNIQWEIK